MNCCFNCGNYKECNSCKLNPCPMLTANKGIYSGCCICSGSGIAHPSQTGCTAHAAKQTKQTCGDCGWFFMKSSPFVGALNQIFCNLAGKNINRTDPTCKYFRLLKNPSNAILQAATQPPNNGIQVNYCGTCINFSVCLSSNPNVVASNSPACPQYNTQSPNNGTQTNFCDTCSHFDSVRCSCAIGAVTGNSFNPKTTTCAYHIVPCSSCSMGASVTATHCPTCSNSQGIYQIQDDETPSDGIEVELFPPEPEPKNNDNRSICFWCKGKTIKIDNGFSFYDYCKRCKK